MSLLYRNRVLYILKDGVVLYPIRINNSSSYNAAFLKYMSVKYSDHFESINTDGTGEFEGIKHKDSALFYPETAKELAVPSPITRELYTFKVTK